MAGFAVKCLFSEIFLIALVSSAPHGLSDESSIVTTSSALKTALTTVFALGTIVSLGIVFFGCICCQQQRIKGRGSQSNGIPLPQHSNHLENTNESEFTIFPPPHTILKQPINLNQHDDAVTFEPLPDIRLRKFSSPVSSGYFPKPAYFSSDVNKGLSLHDWFDDPQANFPRSQLQYFSEVGSGWFGQVVEGEAQLIVPDEKKSQVVVKILREDASPSEHIYFLHEVRLFRDLRHPNIIRLLGRCLEVDPFLVIMEHSSMDLKTYLIQHRSNPESLLQGGQLLRAACHVAKGLNHMHENNFIHTDLAARNCLVSHDHSVKIGDYGISVKAFKEDYYCVGGIALPIRWCSPESLVYSDNAIRTKELTQEANIWSFGVLLWEMIELGKLPYMEFSDEQVLQKTIVEQTLTLEKPKTPCLHKDQLWQVMKLCWSYSTDRPSIQKVSCLLEHLFDNKDVASDSVAFETRWNALQPVVREHNLNPKTIQDPLNIALTFESDFVPNNNQNKLAKNHELLLSSDFDVSSLRETSSSRCSLTQSFENNFGATISPSLQNLRGSLEDLALRNSVQGETKWDPLNVTSNPTSYGTKSSEVKPTMQEQLDDKVINDQICEAIKDLDEFLAGEVTSSEVSKDTTPERNESGDEEAVIKTEDKEVKNCSVTTLTDVGTETGETLPKDSSDDSLHGHLLVELDKQDLNSKTGTLTNKDVNAKNSNNNNDAFLPMTDLKLPSDNGSLPSNETSAKDQIVTSMFANSQKDSPLSQVESHEYQISREILTLSTKADYPEKESQRDSAIVLESESSSSTPSSKIDESFLPYSPINNFPSLSASSSQSNLAENEAQKVNNNQKKGDPSEEEYVSTDASSQALLSSASALSLLNEPLTCGNPGNTASMATGVNGEELLLTSDTNTLTSIVDSPLLLTHPLKTHDFEENNFMQADCDFRSTSNNSDLNELNPDTSSTNKYLSLSLDAITLSKSDFAKDNTINDDLNSVIKSDGAGQELSKNSLDSPQSDISDEEGDGNDVMEGATDELELHVFSDSDLESLGEGYDASPKCCKSSTPTKDNSKPSVSLSESSLGATYYTACDRSNLDESLKLEETSVLPFIEITLCEDNETDTMFDTCLSDTPTLNDGFNSESDPVVNESFEDQLGFLGLDNEGIESERLEAINSEIISRYNQSTPPDQSPSMLSVPSSENLKLDKDCMNDSLFMRIDQGNCRPNYKSQLASFAFEKELNSLSFSHDINSLPTVESNLVTSLSNSHDESSILKNVFEQSNEEIPSDSFVFSRNLSTVNSSYVNGDFEQSNPEISSNSFVYVNADHSTSWFRPPPQYHADSEANGSYYDEEESIVEDISEEFGAQAPKYQKSATQFANHEYQLEDILACLDDMGGGNDNPAYSEEDRESNPSIFSPVEDSGKYSSMADDDDNSIILDDMNQGAHCSDDIKDYLDDELLIIDTETNEAVMLDSKERLTLAMGEENMAYYERQLYINEVYDPENYYGPTKLESIVEEFEGNSNATSPAYSGNSNLSNDVSPDKSYDNSGIQLKINNYGFNSQEELDKSISDACSCGQLSDEDECSTNFGIRSAEDSIENSPKVKINPPVLVFEGEEYLAGAETDDGFDDDENEEFDNKQTERPGTSMLMVKEFQECYSQSASETDEEDFISPKEKRDEVYTPDFDSDTDDTSSTGTSESSTSGSFECSNDALDEENLSKASTPTQSPKKDSVDTTPTSPVKIFSTAWDCTISPAKSAIKSPEKKSGDMKKSVSFHEEDPAYIFSYPPESDSDDDEEGNEEATEFTWHVDYSNYADWEFQPIDDEEIPEDIVELDDIDIPEPTPPAPVNLSTMIYSISGISADDLLDSLDSQTQMSNNNGMVIGNFGSYDYPNMVEDTQQNDNDNRHIWLKYATEQETNDDFEEGEAAWPNDDFPEIVTSVDSDQDLDHIIETVNPFMVELSLDLPDASNVEIDCDDRNVYENNCTDLVNKLRETGSTDVTGKSNEGKIDKMVQSAVFDESNDINEPVRLETEEITLNERAEEELPIASHTTNKMNKSPPKCSEVAKFLSAESLIFLEKGKLTPFYVSANDNSETVNQSAGQILESRVEESNFEEGYEQESEKMVQLPLPDICNDAIQSEKNEISKLSHLSEPSSPEIPGHQTKCNSIDDPLILELKNTVLRSEAPYLNHEDLREPLVEKNKLISPVNDSEINLNASSDSVLAKQRQDLTQHSDIHSSKPQDLSGVDEFPVEEVLVVDRDATKMKSPYKHNVETHHPKVPVPVFQSKLLDNIQNKTYGNLYNYNLNEKMEPHQDIPLEIDEILFEMEKSFSLTDISTVSPEHLTPSDEYKAKPLHENPRPFLRFKEDSLEGESSESKSSSSLPKLNDISPALSSESDLDDLRDDGQTDVSGKYVIQNHDFQTDNLLNSSPIVNANYLHDKKEALNYENNNEERERFLNEVVNKDLVTKLKTDNSASRESLSS